MQIVCSRKYPQFAAGIFLHVQGQNQEQATLLPERLDDLIGDDNAVRLIDAFVDSLDLKAPGFARIETKGTGRPPYHPGDLLKLYLYGYMYRIRSCRTAACA